MRRELRLRKDTLTELTAGELDSVAGAATTDAVCGALSFQAGCLYPTCGPQCTARSAVTRLGF
jgi:hypothetical protein